MRDATFRTLPVLLLCSFLPGAIPSPESHFGHRMGADRKLLDWSMVVSYFELLSQNSDRIQVTRLGQSTEKKPFLAVTISSADTIRNLDHFRQIQTKLADPRRTSEAEAERLEKQGKVVVLITCSIHSTEVASTMSAIEFAYRLLTEDTPKSRAILDNVIFILVPSLNPDGVDIVTKWYRSTLGTPFEGTSPPELYQKYVGHDNNRDWYIFSQNETRLTISKLHNVWHPQIVYDVHQQGAYSSRMFVPPWLDPIDPNVDPILVQLQNSVGSTMASDLTAAGKTGIAINAMYDFWTASRHYQAYHGGLRILSESASARLASPISVAPEELNETALGYSPRERSWNHLEPWSGGIWRLRDIVEYQLIAMESCLYQAALRREDFLKSFYRVGKHAVERTAPYAFVIPEPQVDPGATKALLDTLAFGQIEIDRALAPFQAGGTTYRTGTHIIKMQQPYSSWAKTLLERQRYPDLRLYPGGPPKRPYDVTAQTLPLLMGVSVDTVGQPFTSQSVRAESFGSVVKSSAPTGSVLPAADTDSWRTITRTWKSGGRVWRNPTNGDFGLTSAPGSIERKAPRIGLYKSNVPNMDEGWTRWLLEQFEFSYKRVGNRDLQAGNLNQNFDVIVVPEQRSQTLQNGFPPGTMPDEFTGGIGTKGVESLKQFSSRGGTIIFLNGACDYAIQHLSLPVRDVLSSLSNRDFYAPGSLLNVHLDTSHPLNYGMPAEAAIWFEEGPAFELAPGSRDKAAATYPDRKLLASGWLLGEKYLFNRAAVVDVPLGSGHVVLFGMRPQYRAQSYLTFKMFFNSLLLSE